jgi:hypothetical protein
MVGVGSGNVSLGYRWFMHEITWRLRVAFVDAYPRYVAQVLVDRGIEMDVVIADAIVEGTSVLDGLLTHLAEMPAESHRQSPLELFREALRPVGRALATAGVAPPEADRGAISIVAWDQYMLSPASSSALGPDAHDAHLRWGIWKAQEMRSGDALPRPPSVSVRCGDADREVIERQVLAAGYSMAVELSESTFCVVDMDGVAQEQDLAEALDSGSRTIVFGSEIDDLQSVALRTRGAWKVVSRRQALTGLATVLPVVA